jgi:hypothetical protein
MFRISFIFLAQERSLSSFSILNFLKKKIFCSKDFFNFFKKKHTNSTNMNTQFPLVIPFLLTFSLELNTNFVNNENSTKSFSHSYLCFTPKDDSSAEQTEESLKPLYSLETVLGEKRLPPLEDQLADLVLYNQ